MSSSKTKKTKGLWAFAPRASPTLLFHFFRCRPVLQFLPNILFLSPNCLEM
jgi:hypothetical protein